MRLCRYKKLLGDKMQVILLSGDRENRRQARQECGVDAFSIYEYAKLRTDDKELLDLAAHWGEGEGGRPATCSPGSQSNSLVCFRSCHTLPSVA